MIILLLILIGVLFSLFGAANSLVSGGKVKITTAKEVLDYLRDYIEDESVFRTYLMKHYSYKTAPDDLIDFIKKIIRDKDIKTLTDFIEDAQLTAQSFLNAESKVDFIKSDLTQEVTPEDYDILIKDAKDLVSELGLKYKYGESELRRILRKHMDAWKHFMLKDGNMTIDKLSMRVLLRNYLCCKSMSTKKELNELKSLLNELYPNLYYQDNSKDLIRVLKELRDYRYLHPPSTSIEDIARKYGVDPNQLRIYMQQYPHLTPEQIIAQVLGRRADSHGSAVHTH